RRTFQDCSPRATSAAARSSTARPRSARARWRSRSSTPAWRGSAVSDLTTSAPLATPNDAVVSEFAHLATDERIDRAEAALASVGMTAIVVASGDEARLAVENLL